MGRVLWVAAGGAFGAVLRYAVAAGVTRLMGPDWPWATLSVNVLGSLAIGILFAVAERTPLTAGMAVFLFAGILGAFTTFSAFAMDSVVLFREGRLLAAAAYVLAANGVCILAAFAGLRIGQGL